MGVRIFGTCYSICIMVKFRISEGKMWIYITPGPQSIHWRVKLILSHGLGTS